MVSHGHVRVLRVTCEGDEHSSSQKRSRGTGAVGADVSVDGKLVMASDVTGIWDGFVPWTGISWATGHKYCIFCVLEGVPAMRPLDVP